MTKNELIDNMALNAGGRAFPEVVKKNMTFISKIMTNTVYKI